MTASFSSLQSDAILLLRQLIRTPSFSKEEAGTAALIAGFLQERDIPCIRIGHNIIAKNKHYDAGKPVIVLNSHHDTVKPDSGYTRDPFSAAIENDMLFGLGSNDAGASLVALLAAFLYFWPRQELPFNLVMAATAEEEISGSGGVEAVFRSDVFQAFCGTSDYSNWCGIVGEPTQLQLAVAEKGLLVIDALAEGCAGHAARDEGVNAIYIALQDIAFLQQLRMQEVSPLTGEVKTTVTVIGTDNTQHNVVPSRCHFVIDVRYNECYTPEALFSYLQQQLRSRLSPRSMRLRASAIGREHPLVRAGLQMNRRVFGSPTLSDKALLPFPALKMGPGDSARSHTADEYIHLSEIRQGIADYIQLLQNVTF